MKHTLKLAAILILPLLFSTSIQARNTTLMLPIQKALKKGKAKGVIDPSIRVQFGKRALSRGQEKFTASRKTNAFNKTDKEACEWAFLSAVKSLQERAKKRGVRRVTGIVNFYNRIPRSNPSKYECHVGTFVSRVSLQGNI